MISSAILLAVQMACCGIEPVVQVSNRVNRFSTSNNIQCIKANRFTNGLLCCRASSDLLFHEASSTNGLYNQSDPWVRVVFVFRYM